VKLFDLTGRVAVITGGNAGIGLGIAKGLAAAGAAIAIAGRRTEENRAAANSIKAFKVRTAAFEADVSQEESCRSLLFSSGDTSYGATPSPKARNRCHAGRC